MRIVFQFTGGPLDGKTVESEWGEQDEAGRYYALTHHGRIGQRFSVASQYAIDILAEEQLQDERRHQFQKHMYEVTDRVEVEDEVIVSVEYVPPKHPND